MVYSFSGNMLAGLNGDNLRVFFLCDINKHDTTCNIDSILPRKHIIAANALTQERRVSGVSLKPDVIMFSKIFLISHFWTILTNNIPSYFGLLP